VSRSVLWDSSAILALLDADDSDHAHAMAVARDIASERRPSFITNYVEAETHVPCYRRRRKAPGFSRRDTSRSRTSRRDRFMRHEGPATPHARTVGGRLDSISNALHSI
jgi:predicted nucleic acid-binding protein